MSYFRHSKHWARRRRQCCSGSVGRCAGARTFELRDLRLCDADGRKTYQNTGTGKGCSKVDVQPVLTLPAPRQAAPARNGANETRAISPASFPRVDNETQRSRDGDRRQDPRGRTRRRGIETAGADGGVQQRRAGASGQRAQLRALPRARGATAGRLATHGKQPRVPEAGISVAAAPVARNLSTAPTIGAPAEAAR